ncbi:hypothetical protein EXIGLDRAFT_262812 [Exidia glandulosa HHB12029]|uniref:Uncharacterized protein n=1 Tax=Exidia glandulosa HHB12029 TaxID=1314781 RepID=A0A165DRZ9_EXIGL|nr:hypothetical protein EXIGLDRAFT_262812 [Exidia glandulosa HHB12029]
MQRTAASPLSRVSDSVGACRLREVHERGPEHAHLARLPSCSMSTLRPLSVPPPHAVQSRPTLSRLVTPSCPVAFSDPSSFSPPAP